MFESLFNGQYAQPATREVAVPEGFAVRQNCGCEICSTVRSRQERAKKSARVKYSAETRADRKGKVVVRVHQLGNRENYFFKVANFAEVDFDRITRENNDYATLLVTCGDGDEQAVLLVASNLLAGYEGAVAGWGVEDFAKGILPVMGGYGEEKTPYFTDDDTEANLNGYRGAVVMQADLPYIWDDVCKLIQANLQGNRKNRYGDTETKQAVAEETAAVVAMLQALGLSPDEFNLTAEDESLQLEGQATLSSGQESVTLQFRFRLS